MIKGKLYTPEQVAELFQVSAQTVRNWLSSGELKGMKLSSRAWRIKESDLEVFIKAGEDAGTKGNE